MKIDLWEGSKDMRPGSVLRSLVEVVLGSGWENYVTIYVKDEQRSSSTLFIFNGYKLHNEDGPAAVKLDGSMEWWLDGKKLFVQTQKEFESYMRNKAFW